jgi:hypothetical protein
MVIANPKGNLRACESLLGHIAELLVDVEEQARDGGLADVQALAQGLQTQASDALADVRARLAQLSGARS